MSYRVAIASQKGGCGKTTTALNLALALAEQGKSTLLVDLDPQGAIGHSLGKGETELTGIADTLAGNCEPQAAVTPTKVAQLSLLTRGRLDPVDVGDFECALAQDGAFNRILSSIEDNIDIVVIDTPSGLGLPTRVALSVSDFVLVPVQAEPLSLRSVSQVLRVIEHVQSAENPKLKLLGLLPTMVDRDSDTSMGVLVAAWRQLCGVFEATVPRVDAFVRASELGVPLAYAGGPVSPEAKRFDAIASEVLDGIYSMSEESQRHVEQPVRRLL